MRRISLLVIAAAALLGACASSNRIERSADRHEARARQLDEKGDFHAATKERKAAAKQYSKANTRRGFEDAMPVVFN
ncbi:MAG: hypothetical protein ACXVAN_02025 [Polyangia bacterium]